MSQSIRKQKQELRTELQRQRDRLSPDIAVERSTRICSRILEMELFRTSKIIHSYVPIHQKNEVDTLPIIRGAFERGKEVVVPKVVANHQLDHYRIERLGDLETGKWGIPEPVRGTLVSPERLDLIFVPMLAGDIFKNRLGFGRGGYDRLLLKTKAVKIGRVYHFPLVENPLPTGVFGVPSVPVVC